MNSDGAILNRQLVQTQGKIELVRNADSVQRLDTYHKILASKTIPAAILDG